jgi:putative membrane protein
MMHAWNGGAWAQGGYGIGFPWGGLVMGVLMLVVLGFAIFAIVRLARHGNAVGSPPSGGKALGILSERFAKGEIDADTFRSMKAELEALE